MIESSIPEIVCRTCGRRGEEIRTRDHWTCREWFWREVYEKERVAEGTRAVYSWPCLCAEVLAREKFTCQDCGKRYPDDLDRPPEIHHVIPVAKQGSNRPENLMALCRECHRKIHAKARLTKHRDQAELGFE
ncbi:MAG: HNH endonuclease [Methanobacteriota archaeon]|nr:MAG: HNH endonuclease [Euryarchaeota archaeon]